jgi:hypothetical protein
VVQLIQQFWVSDNRKMTVCIDSYDNGILRGRFYNAYHEAGSFESLSQFLIRMEALLEENQTPQAYTAHRTFSAILQPDDESSTPSGLRKGAKATFELQVLFRQHSSWQGVVIWQERKAEQSFRSVLELVILMDSALRDMEDSVAS